jgi:hypothetical protein
MTGGGETFGRSLQWLPLFLNVSEQCSLPNREEIFFFLLLLYCCKGTIMASALKGSPQGLTALYTSAGNFHRKNCHEFPWVKLLQCFWKNQFALKSEGDLAMLYKKYNLSKDKHLLLELAKKIHVYLQI